MKETVMRMNLAVAAVGLGFGMFGAMAQAAVQDGFDGLSVIFLALAVLLVYFGGRAALS